jgi:hypothetical protein
MILKRHSDDPQAYIAVGMGFFLAAMFTSMISDGRLLEAFLTGLLSGRILELVQGFCAGLSIPLSMASIYFNLRGLVLYRARRS